MSLQPIERITATKILIKVNGFYDAKDWMYRILRAGIATCSECDKPAKRIYWQDQAEWYFQCEDHADYGDMWTGSTRWSGTIFSKRVFPELAQAWMETLEPDERKRVKLKEYDATDYYSLLPDDHWRNADEVWLAGDKERRWGTYVRLYPMTTGHYAYEITFCSPGYSYTKSLHAPFDGRDEALEAARKETEK